MDKHILLFIVSVLVSLLRLTSLGATLEGMNANNSEGFKNLTTITNLQEQIDETNSK